MVSQHPLGLPLPITYLAPSTWHPAPGTWHGQREEEAPFPGHSPGVFLSSSLVIFTVKLGCVPLISGGFPISGCEHPLEIPSGGLRTEKSLTAAEVGMREGERGGAPILRTPSGLQRSLFSGTGSGHPVISAGSLFLLRGAPTF